MKLWLKSTLSAAILAASTLGAQAAETVRLQGFGVNLISMPQLYAETFGLFEKNGVNFTTVAPIFNTAGIMQSVITGAADFAYTGATSIVPVVAQGRQLKIVAVIAEGMELKLTLTKAASDKLAARGITAASPLKDRMLALKGLTIAAPATGSTTYQGLVYELKKNGVDPVKDVVIQPISDMGAQIAAMRQGVVDGMFGTVGAGIGEVEANGGVRFIAFENEDPGLASLPWNVLIVSDDYLKKNEAAVKGVLAAFAEAKAAIKRGLTADELAKVKAKYFPDMKPESYKLILDSSMKQLTAGNIVGTRLQFDTLLEMGNAASEAPLKVTYEQVFDNRIAEMVVKSK